MAKQTLHNNIIMTMNARCRVFIKFCILVHFTHNSIIPDGDMEGQLSFIVNRLKIKSKGIW